MKLKVSLLLFSLFPLLFSCGEVAIPSGDLLELPAISASDDLVRYEGFILSYNSDFKIPKWVAYELTAEETHGDATREDKNFSMDFSYRRPQARREDYTRSGWSRGHMAPAADFFWSDAAMSETFYLLNICPQDEFLNNKDWQYLEKQVRAWARQYGRVWVVSGPIVEENRYGTIGDHVVVPDAFFKVCLVHDGHRYQGVAFVMNNDHERYYLEKVAMSIDALESRTGLDFYPALPDGVEEQAEAQYDPEVWGLKAVSKSRR